MPLLTVPYLAAAGLLLLSGVLKLYRPAGTAPALRTQGLPPARALVLCVGATEAAVAVAALVGLPWAAPALALTYAGFTLFVLIALVRGRPLSSCGCFAEPDLPPTWAHVALTALLASCAAVADGGPIGLPSAVGAGAIEASAAVASAALTGWLAYVVLAGLPRLQAAAIRPVPTRV